MGSFGEPTENSWRNPQQQLQGEPAATTPGRTRINNSWVNPHQQLLGEPAATTPWGTRSNNSWGNPQQQLLGEPAATTLGGTRSNNSLGNPQQQLVGCLQLEEPRTQQLSPASPIISNDLNEYDYQQTFGNKMYQ